MLSRGTGPQKENSERRVVSLFTKTGYADVRRTARGRILIWNVAFFQAALAVTRNAVRPP